MVSSSEHIKNFRIKQKDIVNNLNSNLKGIRLSNTMGNYRLTLNKFHIILGNKIENLKDNNIKRKFIKELIDKLEYDLDYIEAEIEKDKLNK